MNLICNWPRSLPYRIKVKLLSHFVISTIWFVYMSWYALVSLNLFWLFPGVSVDLPDQNTWLAGGLCLKYDISNVLKRRTQSMKEGKEDYRRYKGRRNPQTERGGGWVRDYGHWLPLFLCTFKVSILVNSVSWCNGPYIDF